MDKQTSKDKAPLWFIVISSVMLLYSLDATAAIENTGVLDDVIGRYQAASKTWADTITGHASSLFWSLVTISMVWTFGIMALKKADISEFFAEFIRFLMFTGFFWWILINGPAFAGSIINSLREMGAESTGLGKDLNPTNIVDVGFDIFFKAIDKTSVWTPVDSFIGVLLSGIILVILSLVALNMLLMLCSAWVLMYGGVFFLGFGGARWTSDIAINYYKAVLGVGASLFAMTLLIGVGTSVLDTYYAQMSQSIDFREMGVILIVCLALLYLVNKVPALISGIITGASVSHSGIGNLGTGAAIGAAGMASAATAVGGATLMAGAHNIGGGAQALMAAVRSAEQHMGNGEGLFRGAGGITGGGVGSLTEAMGQSVRFAADIGANLAKGSGSVAKEKIGAAVESFNQAASETIGGQVASAIKASGAEGDSESSGGTRKEQGSPNFSNDSLGAGNASSASMNPEVEAFVNKQAPSA